MTTHSTGRARSMVIPMVTLVLLLGIMAFGNISQAPPAGSEQYFSDVAAQIDAVPYRIDDWFGINLPYTEVEVKMLRPNKILQRTYQDQTSGKKASLSIVHCTDVRDMLGHFPPVCYPAHGWDMDSSDSFEVIVGGRAQEARCYRFSRLNQGTRETISIVSFFIAPSIPDIMWDMNVLERSAKNPQAAGLGAVQVQILTPASQSDEVGAALVSKLIDAVEPVVDTVQAGVK